MMLKRSISLLLCAVLTLSLCLFALPETALAGTREVVIVGGTNVIDGGYWTVGAESKLTKTEDSNNYNVHYDHDNQTLTLKNANITEVGTHTTLSLPDDFVSAVVYANVALTIELIGTNELKGAANVKYSAGIFVDGAVSTLTIKSTSGDGSLTAKGAGTGNDVDYSYGVYSDGNLTINYPCNVTATGGKASQSSYGIYAGQLNILGATVTATGDSANNSYGVHCTSSGMTINAGTLNATGGEATGSKSVSYGVYTATAEILFNGGTVEAKGNTSALSTAPITAFYTSLYTLTASEELDGTAPVPEYKDSDIAKYKYFKIAPPPVSIGQRSMTATAEQPSYYINGSNGEHGAVSRTLPEDGWNAMLELVDGKYKLTLKDLFIKGLTGIDSKVDLILHIDNTPGGTYSSIESSPGPAINVTGNLNVTAGAGMQLLDLQRANDTAVFVEGDLTLNGGILQSTVTTDVPSVVSAFNVEKNLIVNEGGSVIASIKLAHPPLGYSDNCGIKVGGNVVMNGRQMNCKADSGTGLSAGGSVALNSGYITLSGGNWALNKAPDFGDGFSYLWATDKDAQTYTKTKYVHNAAYKFINILPTPSASIGAVEVSGKKGTAITEQTATITLENQTFGEIAENYSVTSWFTNIPAGLTAKIKDATINTATVTFSGTPTATSAEAIKVQIPQAMLNIKIGADLTTTNTRAKWNITSASSGSSGGYDYTPPAVTVYNDPSQPKATVWLTGSGLSSGDLLITERDPQGSAYNALLKLAGSADVFSTYNIGLKSGKKSTGSAMNLTFDLNAQYAGNDFTLVHQKADSTYEYFYDTADANGDLSFGPLYELSPFMLVRGRLAQTAYANLSDVPKTGDSAHPAIVTGIVMLMAIASLAGVALRKRHD